MKFMLAEILKVFPAQAMKPGDVFITNDPYRGGSHLPDIGMYRPVFHGGTFVAFTGCLIHHTDVGGMVPGSNPVRATELYQEGLVIPATKLMDGGIENAAVTAIIRANVRQPDITFGDLQAQEFSDSQRRTKAARPFRPLRGRPGYGCDGCTDCLL